MKKLLKVSQVIVWSTCVTLFFLSCCCCAHKLDGWLFRQLIPLWVFRVENIPNLVFNQACNCGSIRMQMVWYDQGGFTLSLFQTTPRYHHSCDIIQWTQSQITTLVSLKYVHWLIKRASSGHFWLSTVKGIISCLGIGHHWIAVNEINLCTRLA